VSQPVNDGKLEKSSDSDTRSGREEEQVGDLTPLTG